VSFYVANHRKQIGSPVVPIILTVVWFVRTLANRGRQATPSRAVPTDIQPFGRKRRIDSRDVAEIAGPFLRGASWQCPSCGTDAGSLARYCHACGEQRLPIDEPALRRSWRLWSGTLRLLLRPGALTVEHREGRRRSLVPPLALFLAINVVFFISQSLSGIVLMALPLKAHLQDRAGSAWVRSHVEKRTAALGIDVDRYAERFDARQVALAKASVVAMVPLLAMACALIYTPRASARRQEWRLRWPTHWTFALHFFAFALLFLSAFFPLVLFSLLALDRAGMRFSAQQIEFAVIGTMSLALGVYVSRAGSRVHELSLARRVSASVLVVTALFAIERLHGWVVMNATLFTT
jgi:hypothetical protein